MTTPRDRIGTTTQLSRPPFVEQLYSTAAVDTSFSQGTSGHLQLLPTPLSLLRIQLPPLQPQQTRVPDVLIGGATVGVVPNVSEDPNFRSSLCLTQQPNSTNGVS